PPARGIEGLDLRVRIGEGSGEDHASSQSSAEPADRSAAIEFTGEFPPRRQRDHPISSSRPSVNITMKLPILPAVEPANSERKIATKNAVAPGDSCCICRLT